MTWAGALIDGEQPLTLIASDAASAAATARQLGLIGIDRVVSYATPATALRAAGNGAERIGRLGPAEANDVLRARSDRIIDIRAPDEWEAGHLPGVENVPLGRLVEQLSAISREEPIVLQCQSGMRSIIGASLLRRAGFEHVRDLRGGFAAWSAAGLPVERQARPVTGAPDAAS
jgi:hydroxyacylglutathione hydrolase